MIHEHFNIVNSEQQILNLAISNIPEKWTPTFEVNGDKAPDGILCLFDKRYHFEIEFKQIHRKESLQKLSACFPSNKILVCNTLSPFLADYCEQQKINFIDASGNARIHHEDLHLHVQGKKSKEQNEHKMASAKALSEGTMKLAFTLLNDHLLLDRPYRELAKYSGISLGMVSKGMSFLEEQKYVRPAKSGKKLIDGGKPLQERWINDYPTALRPKFNGILLDYPGNWQDLDTYHYCILGGEAGAAKLTQYLEPEQLQVFTNKTLQETIRDLKALPNGGGNLWLIEAFWDKELNITEYGIALLSTAELKCSLDSRNLELAKTLHDRYLAIV